ncbi:MAG: 3-dehydroquinate dehydratase [Ignavibacteriales bacterium UTCHB2]|jgi:3-dehydroquinate dehydratase-2|nr:MAG: 3-dehydroquinate dehydratase [Ignavibacteria bacterium ADurb.Bin266]OQY72291.1 MAG: 3-dehydroquinate dehydratase [Ignavibacteriales bacterium UTCHB2]HQI41554.1 type II 3-dehydroquinate dehydratase [Ignavibacteriaceae bacterium]HQJ45616.1 type II 3-dehydroquinate dehydratase [Ignavibacteriaceae bacterium]
MKILVINGPNLNLLDKRNSDIYSKLSIEEIKELMQNEFPEFTITSFQSNVEGEIIQAIQNADENFDGLIINPGGYAHTSVAIMDALELCKIPKIEVHLSHLAKREDYRQTLLTAKNTDGYISGFKENSYLAALYLLKKILKR